MKVPFDSIWEVTNGTLTNKVKIRCSGITAYPRALLNYQSYFGGIDWALFIGRELEVKTDGDTMVLEGIY